MDLLYLPTKARNEQEEELLEQMSADIDLENPDLRQKVLQYIGERLAVVYWHHLDAQVRISFEDGEAAKRSRRANKDSFPRIIGVRGYLEILAQ